jgi:cytochrome c peroxidase
MKLFKTFITIIVVFMVAAFTSGDHGLFIIPQGWQKPTYNFKKNPLTNAKIELGRALFYDPRLSKDNTISCASCHLARTAFTHVDHDLSHGIQGRIGTRNSPALMNLAWQKHFMWDGAVNHLDVQSLAPITHPKEMDESFPNVLAKLQKTNHYPTLFQRAFGDSMITGEHTLKAIAQFMLTLVSADSKYDKIQRGEKGIAFNQYELRGYELFKIHCASCHTEPLFTNNSFENNGLAMDSTLMDKGRMSVTKRPEDAFKFKVPTLRNVEVSYPYMHDGRFPNLPMVLFHYTESVQQSPTLSNALKKKLILSPDDKRDLIAFMKALTDENFLHNPKFQFYNGLN